MGSKAKIISSIILLFGPSCCFLFPAFEFLRQIPESIPANRKIWSMTVAAATIELFFFSPRLRGLLIVCHTGDGVRFLISKIL